MQDSFRRVGAAALLGAVICLGATQAQAVQCAIFARSVTGLDLSGDAWQWWNHASGTYARGNAPKAGAVLVFMRSAPMRHGHVSVVTRIVNNREILVDHANWGTRGAVARSVPVIDDSPNNDWSSVRVAFGGGYGRSNPTYGFIYDAAASSKDVIEAANHGAGDDQADDRDEVVENAGVHHASHRWIRLAVGHGAQHGRGAYGRQSVRLVAYEAPSHGRQAGRSHLVVATSGSGAHHEAASPAGHGKAQASRTPTAHHDTHVAAAPAKKSHHRG